VNRKRIVTAVAPAILIAGVAGAFVVNGRDAQDNGKAALEYAAAEVRDMEILAEAAGQIEPIRVVEVKSKASGDILQLHGETGDAVPRGTLLAQIDPRDVRNALLQAEADLDVARARLTTSEAQKRRVAELRAASVVTEQEFESAQLEEANARAQFIKAQTSLQLARERMNDVTIRAPIDGTIITKFVEVGDIIASASQNISGGTTLYTMADLSEMQVRALVDETDLGRVEAGLPARVQVEAFPGRVFRGTVLKIEPQAVTEQNVTMFPVLVRLDNREGLLRPGMNADVQIEIAMRPGALVVPNAAVVGVRDAIPAGAVVGISEDRMQAALRGGGGGQQARGAANGSQQNGGAASAAQPVGAVSAECQALLQRMRDGGAQGLSEADRTRLRECRPAGAQGAAGERQAGAAWSGGGNRGGRSAAGDARPGIVFVATDAGIEPRRVMLGLNDWDNTEIVSGIEPGEYVALISVARLQQQQQEFQQRVRERMGGGPFPGASGPGRR
jgi:HlyD family secretion protein